MRPGYLRPLSLTLAIAATLTGASAAEGNANNNADSPSYDVSADFLLFTPRRTSLDYAAPDSSAPTPRSASVGSVDPDTSLGIRLNGDVRWGPDRLLLSITSYGSDGSDETTDPTNGDIAGLYIIDDITSVSQGSIDVAKADWEFDYFGIDIGGGHTFLNAADGFGLELLGGLRFNSSKEKFSIRYDSSTSTNFDAVEMKTDMFSYGLFIGASPSYNFTPNMRLVSNIVYSPQIAMIERSFHYNTATTTEYDLKDENSEVIQHFILSLAFEAVLYKHFVLGIGYELQSLAGYPGFMVHSSESGETANERHDADISMDGLFVRLGGTF